MMRLFGVVLVLLTFSCLVLSQPCTGGGGAPWGTCWTLRQGVILSSRFVGFYSGFTTPSGSRLIIGYGGSNLNRIVSLPRGSLYFQDTATQTITPAPGNGGPVGNYQIGFRNQDGSFGYFVTYSTDPTANLLRVNNLESGTFGLDSALLIPSPAQAITTYALSNDEETAYLLGANGIISIVTNLKGTMAVTTPFQASPACGSGCTITCTIKTSDDKYLIFSTSSGQVIKYDIALQNSTSVLDFPNQAFGKACVQKGDKYALFASDQNGFLFEVDFNGDDELTSPRSVQLSNQPITIAESFTTDDDNYAYFPSYTPSLSPSARIPEVTYEVRITNDTWFVSYVIESVSSDNTNQQYAATYGGFGYVGTNGANATDPTIFELRLANTLIDPPAVIGADFNPKPAGDGAIQSGGFRSSEALDVSWGGATDADLLGENPNGPAVTYIRGKTDEGAAYSEGTFSLSFVSVDEITDQLVFSGNDTANDTFPEYENVRSFAIPYNLPPGRGWAGSTQAVAVGRTQPWEIFTYPIFYGDGLSTNSSNNNSRRSDDLEFNLEKRATVATRGQIASSVTYTIYTDNTNDQTYLAELSYDNYNVSIPLDSETVSVQLVFSEWDFLESTNGLRFHFVLGAGADGSEVGEPVITQIRGDNSTTPAGDNYVFFEVADFPIPNGIATVTLPQFGILTTNRGSGYPAEPGTNFTATFVGNEIVIQSIIPNFQQVVYTFTIKYTYIPPSIPPRESSESSDLDLTPLWIALGCFFGCILLLIIIALIVVGIIAIIKYKRYREKTVENKFAKSEAMLGDL